MQHEIKTPFGSPGYLVLSGSRLYGIDTPDSDYDYVGALIEPAAYRIGLAAHKPEGASHHQHGFEQHMFKGDNYEGSIYSLWKLVTMFAEGNPTTLCLLFANPITDVYNINTDEFRSHVLSVRSGHRFLKYMEAQRKSMVGQRAKHVTRLALVDEHGYDTKFAGHLLRLGYQGCEFLETGHITLPMLEDGGQGNVLDVRAGLWPMDRVISESEALEARMIRALDANAKRLPDDADYEWLNHWLVSEYRIGWLVNSDKEAAQRA